MRGRAFTILLTLLLASTGAAEVQFDIGIRPDGAPISQTDSALLQVRVASDQPITAPELVVSGGQLNARLTFSFSNNLGRSVEVNHRYALSGMPGRYSIKARVRDAGGTAHESEAVTLTVRERTAAERAHDPELLIRFDKPSAFVGEQIQGEVVLVMKPRTTFRPEEGNVPRLSGDGFTPEVLPAWYEVEAIDGNKAFAYRFGATPLRAGEIDIAATFQPEVVVPSATGRGRLMRYSLVARGQAVEIKALPTAGKPADFSGAVGSFELTVGADPLKLNVGEPIALKLSVTGRGNFEAIGTPQPVSTEGWTFYNATRLDLQRGEGQADDRLGFAQNIVPGIPQDAIPAFRLSVFDPAREQYVTLMTDPIPIEVGGSAAATLPQPPTAAADPVDRERPVAEWNDILTGDTGSPPRWAIAANAGWRRAGFWYLSAGLAVGLVLLALVYRIVSGRAGTGGDDLESLLRELERGDHNTGQFYAVAQRYIDGLRSSDAAPSEGGEHEALGEIEARHGMVNFAGDREAAGAPIPSGERSAVIGTLRGLLPQPKAGV